MSFTADAPRQGSRSPRPGDVVAGKYRVDRILGAGGMGVVVAATQLQFGAQVALKFLLPHAAGDTGQDQLVARFLREAELAARITSPHVARVLDVGTREGGEPYMVMELLEGEDLNVLVRRRGALPASEAAELVLQACEAVAEAHELGIVHRDLKPANLFATRGPDGWPQVKVLDFGISKLIGGARGAADASLTSDADVLGSPLYMAPEQIRNPRGVDARCDVWSMGAILYKLLTGHAAFEADNPATILAIILSDAPPGLRERVPSIPEALEALVLRCLEKDAQRRVQSIDELARGLLRFAPARPRGRPWEATVDKTVDETVPGAVVARPAVAAGPAEVTASRRDGFAPAAELRRWALAAVGIAATAAVLGGAVTLLAWSRGAAVPHAAAAPTETVGSAAVAPPLLASPPAPAPASIAVSAAPPAPTPSPATTTAPSTPTQPRLKGGKHVDPLEDRL